MMFARLRERIPTASCGQDEATCNHQAGPGTVQFSALRDVAVVATTVAFRVD